MSGAAPRLFSIPPGAAFLPELAAALCDGRLVPDFLPSPDDPLALAGVTIYLPTRRAARELRRIFLERAGGRSAILPLIRPLGEFDEDAALFDADPSHSLDLLPPIGAMDRLLALAPLVRAWKSRLPAHLAQRFEEEVVVPASAADAIWLARDLADLMDEIETEGANWADLAKIEGVDIAAWWQVTLEFLAIATEHWPRALGELNLSSPGLHRTALIDAEAERLGRSPPAGPVIAAGSTGSIPATARLLSAIARLSQGAVVLPGLDHALDEEAWSLLGGAAAAPSVFGHPQYGLAKLLRSIGAERRDVAALGEAAPGLALRMALVGEALRPAETTDRWADNRGAAQDPSALEGVTLIEAANERDEAAAIAVALRRAIDGDAGRTAALVTGDRDLARRVSSELLRFGIRADDSGGTPLEATPPAVLLRHIVDVTFAPGSPLPILSLLKHPLLRLGRERAAVREAAETVELVALRGGVGRPDGADMADLFRTRLNAAIASAREPFWLARMKAGRLEGAEGMVAALTAALAPLAALRGREVALAEMVRVTVEAFEACGRDEDGAVTDLYGRDAGEKLAGFLRDLVATTADFPVVAREWPDILASLIAGETVKPARGGDGRIAIWGALEARLQSVDTLVIGGLNEGTWPRKTQPGRFMSRLMKAELNLEPPERRIGLAAHDFWMAMGAREVILTRAARSGDAPSSPSRWLQRLTTFAGKDAAAAMRERGADPLAWARALDASERVDRPARPEPTPPVQARPKHFSVTEIETLRRDPYAIYARKILRLTPLDPLLRDPGAADRGLLFHDILHRFSQDVADPHRTDARDRLIAIGREFFAAEALPVDVHAVWWPRFEKLADGIVAWERDRAEGVKARLAEALAARRDIGATGVTLAGRADRIDTRPGGMADILDYKTGSSPSRRQAHMLVSPQLALEGALMLRGAFDEAGASEPAELAYVRLKPNGAVVEESILEIKGSIRSGRELAEDAWGRLEKLVGGYGQETRGYISRALPFREGDMDGDYDHLARVLEWSAGADSAEEGAE